MDLMDGHPGRVRPRQRVGRAPGKGTPVVRTAFFLAFVLAAALPAAGNTAPADPPPEPGSPAPDFALPHADGRGEVILSELWRKRLLVLVFGSYT